MLYLISTEYRGWVNSAVLSLAALLITTATTIESFAAPGSLDPTFGNGGIVQEGAYAFEAIAIQPDGKIVVASFVGEYPDFDIAVFRYNPDGSLDTTFDGDGRVTTDIGARDAGHAVALQPDGKILVGANSVIDHEPQRSSKFVVVRYNPDGSLDTTFDGDGKVLTHIGGHDAAHSIAVHSDGRIVVAGRAHGTDWLQQFVVVRYNSNGSLDTSFGGDGIVTTDFNGQYDVANSVALQPDGKIVTVGTGDGLFTVVRHHSDGSLDTSFDGDGKVTTGTGLNDTANSVAVQPDGKIVAAGNSTTALVLRRYNSDGSLDASFADAGSATISFQAAATATSVALRPDGKIVVAGNYDSGLVVARYDSNGSRDMTFDGDGVVTIGSNDPEGYNYRGNAVAVDTQGRIVIAGAAPYAAIFRFLGTGGRSEFDYDGDGRADVSVRRPGDNVWHLLRGTLGYTAQAFGETGDRMTPSDYDGDGKTDVAVFRPSNGTWYVYMTQSQTFQAFGWGQDGDLPVPTDRDNDGRTDLVIFRPSNNTWYTRFANGTFAETVFGVAGDKPVVGDFDGDGKGDIAVYRPSNNKWYLIKSSLGFFIQTWGVPGDLPLTGDFDGDGATDQAVFRPSTGEWYLSQTTAGFAVKTWGVATDVPVAADYDGDGKTDVAVFRPSEGNWYIINSTAGMQVQNFGLNGDVPTQTAFNY